jgi:hypothetical protein
MKNTENHPLALLRKAINENNNLSEAYVLILGRKELELIKEASSDICKAFGFLNWNNFLSNGKINSVQLLEVDAESEFTLTFHEEKSIAILEDLRKKYPSESEIGMHIDYLKKFYAIS